MKPDTKAFGLACGVLWAAGVLLMGLMAMRCPWAMGFVDMVSTFYPGYDAGIPGILIGTAWGFADAGIGGFLLALL